MATQSPPTTAPKPLQGLGERHKFFAAAATVHPPGSARSLWLFVDKAWRHLDNPNDGTQISVQDAFCTCPERLEVAVRYMNDVIVGLVARSK